MKILIKNGRVIDPANGIDRVCNVLTDGGKIAAVKQSLEFSVQSLVQVIDAAGMWVVPGLVDIHVHFREPGFEHKETIYSGSRAAARGGFTTVCVMANTNPVIDDARMVEWIVSKAEKDSIINVLPVGAVTRGLQGKQLCDMDAMAKAGAVAFSDDGIYITDDSVMEAALINAKRLGMPVFAHCEDLRRSGRDAEITAANRDIELAKKTGAKLHICHISTKEPALCELPPNITREVAPHHFTLSRENIPQNDTNYKMAPPIRPLNDVLAVKEALRRGLIGVIATDHAPHSAAEKQQPCETAPNGVIGLETAVPVSLSLVREGLLTPPQLIAKMTCNPAAVIGSNKGTLSVGADADITIINPEKSYTINETLFASKSKNSPFIGQTAAGSVEYTICGGEIVYRQLTMTEVI